MLVIITGYHVGRETHPKESMHPNDYSTENKSQHEESQEVIPIELEENRIDGSGPD